MPNVLHNKSAHCKRVSQPVVHPIHNLRHPLRSSGLTLLEVLVALTVLVIALCGFYMAYLNALVLEDLTRQSAVAAEAARQKLEQIEGATDFTDVFISNLNKTFAVPGLTPLDPNTPVGQVLFPVQDNALHEDFSDAEWGLPRDLNGDGKI